MFRILDKYIGRTIFSSILLTLFLLISLSGIIKFVEQLRKVGDGNYTIGSAGIFTLLTVPRDIEVFFPMAALLGILLGLGNLAFHGELLVIQAAGFSRLRVAISVIKTSIFLVISMMIIGEWVSPVAEQWARRYRSEKIVGESLIAIDSGLWVKDGNDFIHIQRVINKNDIQEVSIYTFDQKRQLKSIIFASSGRYNSDTCQWELSDVEKSLITNKNEVSSSQSLLIDWKTNLNPEKLGAVLVSPSSLSIRGLYKYIKYLKDSGQESPLYQLSMWKKILSPFSFCVVVLVALSFIFGPLQSVTAGVRTLIGILIGFIFYLLNEGLGNLSLICGIPAALVVMFPSILFFCFSILLLMWRK